MAEYLYELAKIQMTIFVLVLTTIFQQATLNEKVFVTTETPHLYFSFKNDSVVFMANPFQNVSKKFSYRIEKDSVFIPPTWYNGLILDNRIYFDEFTMEPLGSDESREFIKRTKLAIPLRVEIITSFRSSASTLKNLQIRELNILSISGSQDEFEAWVVYWYKVDDQLVSDKAGYKIQFEGEKWSIMEL